MNLRAKLSLLVSAVAISAITSAASANSIQIFGSPVLSPAGVNTNFAYTVEVTAGNEVDSGDFFVLVDFGGYVSVGTIPAGWALVSSANLAVDPAGTATPGGPGTIVPTFAGGIVLNDDVGIPDLVFQYTGTAIVAGASNLVLGTFNIVSSDNALGPLSTIVGSDHESTLPGMPAGQNGDPYITPGTAPVSTPLPAAAWGGMGLLSALGAGKVIRRRRAR